MLISFVVFMLFVNYWMNSWNIALKFCMKICSGFLVLNFLSAFLGRYLKSPNL